MIVCVCQGVRCTTVRAAISGGAASVEDVGVACGAGTDCGSCHGMIEDMIEEVEEAAATRVDAHGRTHLSLTRASA